MPAPDDERRSLRDPDSGRSVARDTAADVADALRGAAQPFVDDALSSVSFLLLAVLMVPVGIVIVAVGFVAIAAVHSALGAPTGVVGSVLSIAGLVGILAALFFSFRALYRRMPRRLRAAYAAPMQPARPNKARSAPRQAISHELIEDGPPDGASPPVPTLTELDARLAPSTPRSAAGEGDGSAG